MARRGDNKRQQIIQAALEQYRGQTICKTTLKDIAEAAQIPLGNLYYYVKTREELVIAVLDACEQDLQGLLSGWAELEAGEWLAAYFDWLLEDPQESVRLGCPFGTLAAELSLLGDPAAPRAAALVQKYRTAVTERTQLLRIEKGDTVFSAIQGAYFIARVLHNPQIYQKTIEEIRHQILQK